MDTITHGIAGALIGKAVFRGGPMFSRQTLTRSAIISWASMLGAIFPDSDVLREMFSRNQLLILTWHRSVTHSLLCLPLWALLLAALTRRVARWRKWDAPSFAALTGIYAVGLLSHILMDLVTSFGTMIWSPLKWSRPAWDLIFIVDFTFTAILLAPQVLAWVYSKKEGLPLRALTSWFVFGLGTLMVAVIGKFVGAPISAQSIAAAVIALAAIFLFPLFRETGLLVRYASWNLVGLFLAFAYVGLAIYNHHVALARVRDFAALENLQPQTVSALPLPPSLFRWDGLVLTSRGVYEMRLDLGATVTSGQSSAANQAEADPLTYRFYPDAQPNSFIEAALRLPEVQTVLWFDRFPVTRFHKEGNDAVVEIADIRFPHIRQDRPPSFTYRVRFNADGNVLSKGWVRP